jgi:hypothetical protein
MLEKRIITFPSDDNQMTDFFNLDRFTESV